MKDTFYFSHDYNARTDVKIKRLLAKTGYRGYGVFWAIIEDLYNNANALPTDYESIAFDLREDSEFVKSIVADFDLFVFEGDIFGSASVERRLSERNEKSEKARQSAIKRWKTKPPQSEPNANALQPLSDGNAIKEIKESKENDIKEIPQPKSSIEYDFAKIKLELKENQYTTKQFVIQQYKLTLDQYLKFVDIFVGEKDNDLHKPLDEVLKHFKNWCRTNHVKLKKDFTTDSPPVAALSKKMIY